jgi:hypothetical protein
VSGKTLGPARWSTQQRSIIVTPLLDGASLVLSDMWFMRCCDGMKLDSIHVASFGGRNVLALCHRSVQASHFPLVRARSSPGPPSLLGYWGAKSSERYWGSGKSRIWRVLLFFVDVQFSGIYSLCFKI